jgi:hypothetical protein
MAKAGTGSGFNTLAVALCTVAALVLVFVLSLFLEGGWFAARNREFAAKVYAPDDTAVRDALAEQRAVLDQGYRWIDKEQGRVGVPIERAVELVVERDGRLTPARAR